MKKACEIEESLGSAITLSPRSGVVVSVGVGVGIGIGVSVGVYSILKFYV